MDHQALNHGIPMPNGPAKDTRDRLAPDPDPSSEQAEERSPPNPKAEPGRSEPPWPFGAIRPFSFDLLVVDPPWLYDLYSANGENKSPQANYTCMPTKAIQDMPIGHLVGMNSWLFLWATAPMLPEAIATMQAWGFQYKTRMSWRKVTRKGKLRVGPGYIVRTMHEDILIGAIGHPSYSRALPSEFDGLARQHSRKPDEFYALIERFAPNARRADIFSRQNRPGWTSWGDETGKFDPAPHDAARAAEPTQRAHRSQANDALFPKENQK